MLTKYGSIERILHSLFLLKVVTMGHQTIYHSGDKVKRAVSTKDPSTYLVDKEKLKADLLEYQQRCNLAESEGKPIPQISNSIGIAFLQIATILSKKHYFIGYSWIDEMISDAVIKCCESVRKFDTSAGTSAFAYFQQVCYFEFIGRINDEKKQKIVKASIVQNIGSQLNDVVTQEVDADEDFHSSMAEILALQSVEIDYKHKKKKEVEIDELPWDIFDVEENGMDKV